MTHLLLLSLGACLVPSASALALLLRHRSETEAVADRIATITESFAAASGDAGRMRARQAPPRTAILIEAERLLGYDRRRRAHEAVPFIKVLAVCSVLAALAAFFTGRLLGPLGWIAAPAAMLVLPRLFYRRCAGRYKAKLFTQFPDALGMIVRAVRVGVGVGNAVVVVAEECQSPTSLEFRQLAEEIAIGRPLPDALRAMGARNDLPEYRFFATALSLQSQTGGGLTETLETLADTIRKRVAIKLRGHALAGEARISCYVLGGLPFVVGALLYVTNPSYVGLLFTTSAGEKMLGVALILLTLGMVSMQTITKRSLR